MRILLNNNTTMLMNELPDDITSPIYYFVLDNSDSSNVDFFAYRLSTISNFPYRTMTLQIGNYFIEVPSKWGILTCTAGELEVVELEDTLGMDMMAFCFNPIDGYAPSFEPFEVIQCTTNERSWFYPETRHSTLITIPLRDQFKEPVVDPKNPQGREKGPPCIYFLQADIAQQHKLKRMKSPIDIQKLF